MQEVFYEFVEASEPAHPLDQIGAWLFQVARNRIIDLFRKKKPERFSDLDRETDEEERASFEDLLPSPDAGPDATFARSALLRELTDAIEELPDEQRRVFVAHEIEGRSFKEIAAETGASVNTLLSRKYYAVMQLRERYERSITNLLGADRGQPRRRKMQKGVIMMSVKVAIMLVIVVAGFTPGVFFCGIG